MPATWSGWLWQADPLTITEQKSGALILVNAPLLFVQLGGVAPACYALGQIEAIKVHHLGPCICKGLCECGVCIALSECF